MKYEDKYDNDIQASPRFWVVGDYKWVPAFEGNEERYSVYIPEYGDSYEINEFIEMEKEDGDPSTAESWITIDDIECEMTALEWIHEHIDSGACLFPEERVHFLCEDTLFLTKREAKKHIESNSHHYTDRAHTFAMTAWRSGEVRQVWDILLNMDWDGFVNEAVGEK